MDIELTLMLTGSDDGPDAELQLEGYGIDTADRQAVIAVLEIALELAKQGASTAPR